MIATIFIASRWDLRILEPFSYPNRKGLFHLHYSGIFTFLFKISCMLSSIETDNLHTPDSSDSSCNTPSLKTSFLALPWRFLHLQYLSGSMRISKCYPGSPLWCRLVRLYSNSRCGWMWIWNLLSISLSSMLTAGYPRLKGWYLPLICGFKYEIHRLVSTRWWARMRLVVSWSGDYEKSVCLNH